jgi:diguanylate cyclase (GGDEF)-like protein/PAS domain S-box-containing protein
MNPTPLARILIVDDETALMQALCNTLRDQGYETTGFSSGEDALNALQDTQFDLLLTDLMMPGMDGVQLLSGALKIDPQLVGILMTGMGTIETAVQAMQAGALDYVLKPFKVSAILPTLARAVNVRRLRMENLELRNTVAIHELNQAIAHTLDPNVLLDKIVDAALAQFEADEASVMLLSEDGRSLFMAAVRGEGRERLLGTRVPVGEGMAWQVASSGEPLVMHGEITDGPATPLYPRREIQSALSMPMITRSKLIGVLNVNCIRARKSFTFGQIKVLSIFTNAAAAGIQAARIYAAERKADGRYREVLNMAADGIVSADEDRRIVVFNHGAEQLFGWRAEEAMGKPLELLLPPDVADRHPQLVQSFGASPDRSRAMAGRKRLYGRHKDGRLVDIEVGISKRTENGKTLYTAVVRDITQRVQHEDRIARLTRLYAALSGVNSAIVRLTSEAELYPEICRIAVEHGNFTSAWIGTFDDKTREIELVASAGTAFREQRVQLDSADAGRRGLLGRAVLEAQIVWDNDLAATPEVGFLRRSVPEARSGAALPFTLDGAVKAVMLLYSDAAGAFGDDELSLLREMAGDVSFALDHIAKARQVDYLATHDQLTGLPNRTLFVDRLEQTLVSAGNAGQLAAVALFDIERFRQINETLGRQAGDALLREFAERLLNLAQGRFSLARIGSDMFAIVYGNFNHVEDVANVAKKRLDEVLAKPFIVNGQQVPVAARVGIAFYPSDGMDAETLFKNAEAAQKRAKTQHEPIVFYTPDLNARVAQQLSMESRLRRALERDEFVLHYQPKVDLSSGRIAGLEALIRWQDPEAGLVPPFQFIPLLEETGLILPVGRWAMQEAARAANALRAGGFAPVRIAANVSPIQLRDKHFVRSVEEAIAAGGDGTHGLDLEITESVIMEDIDANVPKLRALVDMGVELSIDDFGTGYSSLAYIARLPVGVIKIDRAFIKDLKEDGDSRAIVQTMISLTHALDRKVVAEGVETREQLSLLQSLRCNQFQGYLFSKPVVMQEIERMLREQGSPPR